jgi:hypothetical protein
MTLWETQLIIQGACGSCVSIEVFRLPPLVRVRERWVSALMLPKPLAPFTSTPRARFIIGRYQALAHPPRDTTMTSQPQLHRTVSDNIT